MNFCDGSGGFISASKGFAIRIGQNHPFVLIRHAARPFMGEVAS